MRLSRFFRLPSVLILKNFLEGTFNYWNSLFSECGILKEKTGDAPNDETKEI